MAITTYSAAPYSDDFNQDKNYLKILFRPGRSVQVRELNQLQSNIQDQIDKFGRHVFKDGDRVLDGYTNYDSSIQSIGITWANSSTSLTDAQLTALKGKEITSTNWRAKILSAVKVTDNTNGYRLYIKLIGGAGTIANSDSIALASGEASITIPGNTYSGGDTIASVVTAVEAPGFHGGVFQDAGVFFVKGHFVHTDATEAFFAKSVNSNVISKLSGNAVFDITETIVESTTDTSLLDNANGEPNANAPGADRYKISLSLKFVTSDTVAAGQQRIKLLDIKEDKVVNPARTEYSELGKALAERTQEESGSYVINPFKNEVREYFNDGAGNRGKYTAAEIFNGSEANALLPNVTDTATATTEGKKRFVVGVEPGVAYVQGYRVELEDKQDVVCDKGRESSDEGTETNYKLSVNRGQFIEGSLTDSPSGVIELADLTANAFAPNKQYKLFQEATGSNSGTLIGKCRIHAIENTDVNNIRNSTLSAGGPTSAEASKRLYIFDIQLEAGKKLKDAKALALNPSSSDAQTDTVLENSSGFELKDTAENSSRMVYPLGGHDVKSVDITNAERIVQKRYSDSSTSTAGTITITASGNDNFTSTDPEDYVIIQADAGTNTADGETFAKDVTINGKVATIKLRRADGDAPAAANSKNVVVLAPVEVKMVLGKKTQTSSTYTETRTLGHGDIITLNKVDAYSITGVTHNGNALPISDFELFGGQSDTHYGFSQIVYKGSQSLKSAAVVVSFDHYTHTTSGVFAANSYYKSNGSTLVDLEDISQYEDLKLSNCLDFRQSIEISTEGGETKPNSVANVKFTYYKPRRDIIALSQLGELKYVKGNASESPVYPTIPSDSLILYRINKPGYLYSLNDLNVDVANNRRYTMGDIGGLEQRIRNLEYYTALSQLESEAAETQINDGAGLPRFKGGIITDSFRGHGVGDTNSSGYRAAIDRDNFTARPMYLSDNARWSYVSGMGNSGDGLISTNTWNSIGVPPDTLVYSGKRKNSLTLDFIEKVLVDQPYASDHISVNPYDVATWSGNLELSPSSDEWKDVNNVPEIVTNIEGDNSAVLQQIANNPNTLGTEWNEWESEWSPARWSRWNQSGRTDTFTTRTRVSRRRRRIDTFRRELREGIQTSLVENFQREVIDDRVLNVTFVPFIRSRKVHFKASMLKPNTTFFLYFDDVNITSYATDDEAFVQFGGNVAAAGGTDVARYEGKQGSDIITGSLSSSIVSNNAGEVDGWFVIPNNDTLRFRTGSRQVRLTDSSTNNRVLELSSTESTYHAKGLLETRQQTILSTRQLVLERTRLQERRNVLISSRTVRRDPVAQTFMIGNEPTGIFLSSVDIFFQAIDPNLPIELSIVSVENGIPTQKTIPFSRVTKLPGAVNTSPTDASAETKFMFDTPVYLQPGVEYAIVLISNSARYRVWHAEVGGTNVVPSGQTAETINKNVNMGVLLKSQNASTWTPDQNKDLKFTLNRADFKTTSQTGLFTGLSPQRGQVTYINVTNGGSGYLGGPPAVTLSGGGASTQATAKAFVKKGGVIDYIEVVTNGVGYTGLPTVTIAAPSEISIAADGTATDFSNSGSTPNSITLPSHVLEAVNGQQFTYKNNGGNSIDGLTSGDTYHAQTIDSNGNVVSHSRIIQLSTSAWTSSTTAIDITDNGGGSQTLLPVSTAAAAAEKDVWKASAYLPIIQDMLLPESNVNYTLNTAETKAYTVFPGEVIYTGDRVTHDSSSAHGASGADQLKLQAVLSTTDSRISPVVDLDRISLVTFDNIVNDSNEFETTEDSGQCAARYITKSVKLENPSDQVDVYFDAVRPDESTSVEVYARFGNKTSSNSFDAIPWTKIETDGKVPVSSNYQFGEVHYKGLITEEFDQVAIKVLFRSSNRAYVPEIKNLRIIASL